MRSSLLRKLLYLFPLILLLLSFTRINLYRDKVDYYLTKYPNTTVDGSFNAFTKLYPTHWKMLSMSFNTSASYNQESANTDNNQLSQPLYKTAKFQGFPFGAYFSNKITYSNSFSTSIAQSSGFSWLWAGIDIMLVLMSLALAIIFNRKKKFNQPINTYSTLTSANAPQSYSTNPSFKKPLNNQPTESTPFNNNNPPPGNFNNPNVNITNLPSSNASPATPSNPNQQFSDPQ